MYKYKWMRIGSMEGKESQGISTSNLIWGTLFILWGIISLLLTFGMLEVDPDPIEYFLMFFPLLWIVLGIILFIHDDRKIEEVRP